MLVYIFTLHIDAFLKSNYVKHVICNKIYITFILHIYILHLYTFKNNKNKICVIGNISFDRKVPKKQAGQRDGKLIKAKKGC